ncbi:MAG: mechanosensitive ion channel family protein [Planctomycetota bacterium]|jgi:MscS family membrane protein
MTGPRRHSGDGPIRRGVLALALAVLALVAAPAGAQDDPPPAGETSAEAPAARVAFASPLALLRTFLVAMDQETPDFERAAECLDLSEVPREAASSLAFKLYKCMNRVEWVDLEGDDSIPDAEALGYDPIDTWTFFPRQGQVRPAWDARWRVERRQYGRAEELAGSGTIVIDRQPSGEWRFSAATIAGIEALWERLQVLPPLRKTAAEEYRTLASRFESLWPAAFVENDLLGVKYWQWLSLLLLIFLGVVLDFSVRLALSLAARRIIARQGGVARSETMRRMVRPFGLAAAAVLWLGLVRHLDLPTTALAIIMPAVQLFVMLAGVWAAYRVTDLVGEVLASKAERTDTKFDDLLIPLLRKSIKVFITVFGLIYIANSLDVPIAPLLTGLGIGGAGFAFAAKDTLEHLFGSITVIADRPFQVGDWVEIGDVEGTVEEVGFRSTRVRTFYNSLVTIPNGNLVRAVVDNYGLRKYRRWKTHLNVTYDTPPEAIEAFCEGIRQLVRVHPYTRKDYYQVWLHQFGPHSLDVLLYIFYEAPDWSTELRERHRLMLDIVRLADRLGVQFAFPTQTLHVHREDPDRKHEAQVPPSAHAEARAYRDGRRAVEQIIENAAWRRAHPGAYVFRDGGPGSDAEEETQIESKIGGDA